MNLNEKWEEIEQYFTKLEEEGPVPIGNGLDEGEKIGDVRIPEEDMQALNSLIGKVDGVDTMSDAIQRAVRLWCSAMTDDEELPWSNAVQDTLNEKGKQR